MSVIHVISDVVFADEASEFEEGAAQAEDVESLVEPDLGTFVRTVQVLDDVEPLWLREPSGSILGIIEELIVALLTWRGDQIAQEVYLVLPNGPFLFKRFLPLLALLCRFLSHLPRSVFFMLQVLFHGHSPRLMLRFCFLLFFHDLLISSFCIGKCL